MASFNETLSGLKGHGVIVNLSSYLPFVFSFNPPSIKTTKKINFVTIPNIGGSHKKRYFIGFDSKEVSFTLHCVDKGNPMGVKNEIAYFDQLRQPDAGLFSIAGIMNENFPPPQVAFQFGVSFIPLVWDVLDVDIEAKNFSKDDLIGGTIGVPIEALITIQLALAEDHPLNKANSVAEKVSYTLGSIESVTKEGLKLATGIRKEHALGYLANVGKGKNSVGRVNA